MAFEPTPEDMAAARAEGELVDLVLAAAGRSRKRPQRADDSPEIVGVPASPLHRPGAWPAGTRPAGPNICHPNCDCALTRRPPEGTGQ